MVQANDCNLDECEVNNTRIERKIPIEIFQAKLIEYFDIRFKKMLLRRQTDAKLNQIFG